MLQFSTKTFTKILNDLDQLTNSEFVWEKKFDDFSVADLKKLKSDDFRHLCKKRIKELIDQYLKTREKLPNKDINQFSQSVWKTRIVT